MTLSRRNFIKTGGAAAAATMVLPPLLKSCNNLQFSPDVKSYLDHFEVTPQMLQKVIAEAMSKGGDYADLFFEHTISNSLGLEDGKVNSAQSNVDYGVGVRVLKGDQTGFAYTESTSLQDMLKADHPGLRLIQEADRATEVCQGLTNQLLTFSTGGEPLMEPVDFKEQRLYLP